MSARQQTRSSLRVSANAKRTRAPYPGFIEPCHPSERDRPPTGSAWLHEIKSDGYRAQVHLRDGKVTVYSRRGHDWSSEFSSIAKAAEALPARHAVLDGEAVVLSEKGVADFHALRRELAKKQQGQLTFYAFDLLYLDGKDLRPLPFATRKQHLKKLLADAPHLFLYADHLEAEGEEVFAHACRMGLEGIVSKRRDAPYRSGPQESWIKTKCTKSASFPIIAFVEKLGARPRRIASFYIARREGDRLLYAGKVRGGFTHAEAQDIRERLDPLTVRPCRSRSRNPRRPGSNPASRRRWKTAA